MITNKQYKEDINSLMHIIRVLYETYGRSIDYEELQKLQGRINAISDERVWTPNELMKENTERMWLGLDPITPAVPLRDDDEPHDLGNVMHIPSEDD